jgi:hypothetical protein
MRINGSCLCGGIEYEVNGEFGRVVNCHCPMSRKATGAAFRTRAGSKAQWFEITDDLSRFPEAEDG